MTMLGGKCEGCGYNKVTNALDFHHRNPKTKLHNVGALLYDTKSWQLAIYEAKKCALLCSRCHREVHAGIRKLKPAA